VVHKPVFCGCCGHRVLEDHFPLCGLSHFLGCQFR
jgi:hypothetical protein